VKAEREPPSSERRRLLQGKAAPEKGKGAQEAGHGLKSSMSPSSKLKLPTPTENRRSGRINTLNQVEPPSVPLKPRKIPAVVETPHVSSWSDLDHAEAFDSICCQVRLRDLPAVGFLHPLLTWGSGNRSRKLVGCASRSPETGLQQ
jgi:hypothetical protein